MRLFVAIPFLKTVTERLASLETSIPGLKWKNPEQFHLTLRFIGSVDPPVMEQLKQNLSTISINRFRVDIGGFGFFPDAKHPRVLWTGISESSSLMNLQEKVEDACRETGLEAEARSYVPHITLAKVQKRSDMLLNHLEKHRGFQLNDIAVTKFNLYQSELTKEGAVHTVLQAYPLN